jgi:hypothetical protein
MISIVRHLTCLWRWRCMEGPCRRAAPAEEEVTRGCFTKNAATWVSGLDAYFWLHWKGEAESSESWLQWHACRKAEKLDPHSTLSPNFVLSSILMPRYMDFSTEYLRWQLLTYRQCSCPVNLNCAISTLDHLPVISHSVTHSSQRFKKKPWIQRTVY